MSLPASVPSTSPRPPRGAAQHLGWEGGKGGEHTSRRAAGGSPGLVGLPVLGSARRAVRRHGSLNCVMGRGGLPRSLSKGPIDLLCKDESRPTNHCGGPPVTLLNTAGYNLVAKCLASRLTPAHDEVVGCYQTCCVPGRSVQLHGLALRNFLTRESDGFPAWSAPSTRRGPLTV